MIGGGEAGEEVIGRKAGAFGERRWEVERGTGEMEK